MHGQADNQNRRQRTKSDKSKSPNHTRDPKDRLRQLQDDIKSTQGDPRLSIVCSKGAIEGHKMSPNGDPKAAKTGSKNRHRKETLIWTKTLLWLQPQQHFQKSTTPQIWHNRVPTIIKNLLGTITARHAWPS